MPRSDHPGRRPLRKRKSKPRYASDAPSAPRDPKELLHELFDDLEVGVANVTFDGLIAYSNHRFSMTLRNPPHRDITGVKLRQFISPHSWEQLEIALRQSAHQPVVAEIKLNGPDGKTQTIRLWLRPAHVMGESVIRIVADEVTELVETNSQLLVTEASLRALSGRLLQLQDQERRKMARDLHDTTGQELAFLVMSLRRLANSGDKRGEDLHQALLTAANLAQKVNDDIRTLSYVLHPPLLDQLGLGSALKWYIEGFSKRSNIQVNLVIPDDLPRFSLEKETALFRVVQEGLTNVLRHAETDKAKIVVCVSADEVEVTVKDEGKGFSSVDMLRLVPSGGTSSNEVGVGIPGLRERLHQLGGKLEIFSSRGGVTLRTIVPLDESEAATEVLPTNLPCADSGVLSAATNGNSPKRILIVDDHEIMRRGIRGLVENYPDLEICGEASDGREAVQKARELQPDLVIMDLNMPGAGGLSAANEIQRFEIPSKILVFSTHIFAGIERVLRNAGCKGLVSKVHTERDLVRGIRAVLAGGEFFESSPAGNVSAPASRAQTA